MVSMACSVGIPLAYSSESSFILRHLGREYVSIHRRVRLARSTGVGANSVPDKPDFRADLDPSACSGWLRPAGWAVAILFPSQPKAHRSVYNTSKALYSGSLEAERPVYMARWEAHMAVAPIRGQWVAQQ